MWPKGSLLAQVLGIVGIDNNGLEGLEYEYDTVLSGTQGKFTVEVDAIGRKCPIHKGLCAPVQGKNLVVTIDEVIQFIAERELEAKVKETNAEGGLIIAMNPSNGEILALQSALSTTPTSTMSIRLRTEESGPSPTPFRRVLPSNPSLPLPPWKAAQ